MKPGWVSVVLWGIVVVMLGACVMHALAGRPEEVPIPALTAVVLSAFAIALGRTSRHQ